MIEGIRTCPKCFARVIPTANDLCPACRSHQFGASDPPPADVMATKRANEETDLYVGAKLYSWLQRMVVAQILAIAILATVIGLWPTQFPATDLEFAAQLIGAVLGLAILVAAYRLAKWMRWGTPFLDAVVLAIPVLGVLAFILFVRKVLAEFRARGVPTGFFGPRLPPRPGQAASEPSAKI